MPAKKNDTKNDDPKTVSWNIHELPSAQHKCGLAGLAMMIPNWERTKNKNGLLRVDELSEDRLTITADREGMKSLFDHMFSLDVVESVVWDPAPKKGKNGKLSTAKPKVPVEREGKVLLGRIEGGYRIATDTPRFPLMVEWEDPTKGGDRLWKNNAISFFMMRSSPAARLSRFYDRYNLGRQFLKPKKSQDSVHEPFDMMGSANLESVVNTWSLTGSKITLEGVAVEEEEHVSFLLRFWEQILPVFLLPSYKADGSMDFGDTSYVIAVPEITDLSGFCRNWPLVMKGRANEPHYVNSSWPSSSVLQHPVEAGLSLFHIMGKFSHKNSLVHRNIAGTHVYVMSKAGHVTRISRSMWVAPTEAMKDDYAAVLAQNIKSRVWHRQQVENVVEQRPWWHGAESMATLIPLSEWGMVKKDKEKEAFTPYLLLGIQQTYQKELMKMSTPTLEEIVLNRIRRYVYERADKRSGTKASEHARDAEREKIAAEVFLALRARAKSPTAFVRYWAETICSVPAFGGAGFNELAEFFANPKSPTGVKVRNLSFLALSSLKASTKKKVEAAAPAAEVEVDNSKDDSVVADDEDLDLVA